MESGSEGENRKAAWKERSRQNSEIWRAFQKKLKPRPDRPKKGNLPRVVDVRLLREAVGRDLICNSCQHHVPGSLKHSILCRSYSPLGPPETPLYRCFTSCPNCFNEWELWPNSLDADNFNVLSGATHHSPDAAEIIPEPNPNHGGERTII